MSNNTVNSIQLEHISKKYGANWIFKDINYTFLENTTTAIIGHNGSGKSTLLSIILGTTLPTKGKVHYPFSIQEIHQQVSLVTPYQQIPQDLTLNELIDFHFKCKPISSGLTASSVLEHIQLEAHGSKLISSLSSGMQQRVKLGLAFFSSTPILLLDEPTISLDKNTCQWYKNTILDLKQKKTIIICSNDENEYDFADGKLAVSVSKD